MSGPRALVAVVALDGRPIARSVVASMAGTDAADGELWVDQAVALWPAAVEERTVVAFTGRLDGPQGGAGNGAPAAVARRHEQLGDDAPAGLLGEFAYAWWDRKWRRLVVAKDHVGSRPCYWWSDGRTFIAASRIAAVLAHPDVRRTPNEGMLAEFLAAAATSVEETLWQGVSRLDAAHQLVVADGGVRAPRRYWRLEPGDRFRGVDRADAEHLTREAVEQAVADRLRGEGRVGLELSGGLDSSTLVGVAHDLRSRRALDWDDVEAYACIFPGRAHDERPYIDAVSARWTLPTRRLRVEPLGPDAALALAAADPDLPDTTPGWHVLQREAAARGRTVLLNGSGGDELLGGSHALLAELAWSGRLADVRRELARAGATGAAAWWSGLVRPVIGDYLPAAIRRRRGPEAQPIPRWITRALAVRTDLVSRVHAAPAPPLVARPSQRFLARIVSGRWFGLGFDANDRLGRTHGVTLTSPLLDRRVLELAWRQPERVRHEDGDHRALHRRAFGDVLPALVAERRTKPEFSAGHVEQWRALGGADFLLRSELGRNGLIDPFAAAEDFRRFVSAVDRGDPSHGLWPLALAFALELWWQGHLR